MSRKKIILKRNDGLYLKHTKEKGRGVFCKKDIRAGEILETTPSIVLNEKATGLVDKTMLLNYTFVTGRIPKAVRERKGIKKVDMASVLIMGVLTFCNHDEKPNAEVEWEEHEGTLYYNLKATRKIPKNTEICTSYGEGWFDDRK